MEIIVDIETTGTDPLKDRIIAIGIRKVNINVRAVDCRDEQDMLEQFWRIIHNENIQRIIGFNVDFDWTFIKLRSLKYGIKIRHFRKHEERIDIRHILNSNRYAKGTLNDYAKFFGIPYNSNISGKEIPQLWKKYGETGDEKVIDAIMDHCKEDVEVTYQIYKKLKECGLIG